MKIRGLSQTVALFVIAAGSTGLSAAMAQVPGAVGQPQPRPERPELVTPAQRQAEDYTEKGTRLGGFKLYSSLEADEVFNDNIYATSSSLGTVPAFIQLINPSISLKSDWNNHMLNMFALARFGLYSIDPSLNNYQDVSVGGDGRLDIQRNWNVYGGATWNRLHEVFGSPNTTNTPGFPVTVFNQTSANVGYFQKFNRLSARLDGRLDYYDYINNTFGSTQGLIANNTRDRNEWREALRFGYEFIDGFEGWVRGSTNQRQYFQLDSSGLDRSSNGFDVVGGILIDISALTAVEVFAGYMQQNYRSSQFANISTPTFGLTGYWNPLHELWVRPFVRRVIDDSAFADAAAFINTAAGLDVSYLARPNVQIDGHADYTIADYTVSGGGGAPYDQYITLRLGAMYYPTSNFYLGPTYQFV
ncbi:MAG: outer membrane beta-barrel protein, partial [Alphaproteobacteria bacterium]|nr:outer membrane beta-barrel protein [Alphaproteobacteria bacterium]